LKKPVPVLTNKLSDMRTWILICISLFMITRAAQGQQQVGCTQLLEDAREAYQAGMVELVPELLNPCLKSGLSGEALQEAYRLVINAYLFDYLPDRADALMEEFLEKFPDYQPGSGETSEFVLLLETKRQELARRQVELERQRQQELREREKAARQERVRQEEVPVESEPFGSIGFSLGGNVVFPQIIEKYSTGDPELDPGDFSFSAPGFHLGGIMGLRMGRSTEAAFGINYTRLRLHYVGEPFSFTSYTCNEYENWLGIPVSLAVKFNPDSRVKVYIRFGLTGEYLLSAAAAATRTYTETGTTYFRDVVLEKVTITDSRKRMNMLGSGGLGIRFPFPGGMVFLESDFHYGIFPTNDPEYRYDNQDMTWLIYHVDSDFRVNYLTLSAGIVWNLHKSQNF
jgi:hypothetical protein